MGSSQQINFYLLIYPRVGRLRPYVGHLHCAPQMCPLPADNESLHIPIAKVNMDSLRTRCKPLLATLGLPVRGPRPIHSNDHTHCTPETGPVPLRGPHGSNSTHIQAEGEVSGQPHSRELRKCDLPDLPHRTEWYRCCVTAAVGVPLG